MKEGTGGDPFSDDDGFDESAEDDSAGTDGTTAGAEVSQDAPAQDSASSSPESNDESQRDGDGLPWAVERNSVKSEREMVQFYLRNFVQERESEFQRDVETVTGYDTYLTDIREAAYLVAMDHPEEVADLLNDWGCEYD